MTTRRALEQLTPDQLRRLRSQVGDVVRERIDEVLRIQPEPPAADPRRPSERRMNNTEARWWAAEVEPRLCAGEILWCEHEAIKLRVGEERAFYSPDFPIVLADGSIEMTEVKGGYIREDARVKFMAAAKLYPFWRWRMVQWKDGRWHVLYDYPPIGRRAVHQPNGGR